MPWRVQAPELNVHLFRHIDVNQNEIFSREEGNAWFNRNAAKLQTLEQARLAEDVRYTCQTLAPFKADIEQVLEIGCSNGIKLEAICQALDASGVGIEPSSDAVDAGMARNKAAKIQLLTGTGDDLPCPAESFDLVCFAFCLYLFDRKTLMRALSEADRVLKPGGFLVITDFDPGFSHKRPYDHYQGLFSYKQDYTAFYTASAFYHLVGKHSFSHSRPSFDENSDERVATSILYKEIAPYPQYK